MKHAPMLLLGLLSLATASSTAPRTLAIDAQTQQQLTADVNAIKAATQQDRKTAEDALTTLTSHVAAAQAAGHLNATRAQRILAAADRIKNDVRTMPTPTPATITVTVPPATIITAPPATTVTVPPATTGTVPPVVTAPPATTVTVPPATTGTVPPATPTSASAPGAAAGRRPPLTPTTSSRRSRRGSNGVTS